jgi:hypothetical protein
MPRIEKSELVAAVLNRLSNPKSWTKGTSARNSGGRAISLNSPEAQSWCLTGAIQRELFDRGFIPDHLTGALSQEIVATFREQYPEFGGPSWIMSFNDDPHMTHDGVKGVLEKVYTKLIERGE